MIDDDDEFEDVVDVFESSYNFRFEEPYVSLSLEPHFTSSLSSCASSSHSLFLNTYIATPHTSLRSPVTSTPYGVQRLIPSVVKRRVNVERNVRKKS